MNHQANLPQYRNGNIRFDSVGPGRGGSSAPAESGHACESHDIDASERTVLVVDDDYNFASEMANGFQSWGFRTWKANDGNAGLALALTKKPDLIILDTRMPKRSGYLVLEYLRYASDHLCPVVMLSDSEGERHRAYAKMLGASEFLAKPLSADYVIARACELLEQYNR